MDFMKLGKYKESSNYSGWIVQKKLDGVFAALNLKDGVVYSRTQLPLFVPPESVLFQNISELKSVYNRDKAELAEHIWCFGHKVEGIDFKYIPMENVRLYPGIQLCRVYQERYMGRKEKDN